MMYLFTLIYDVLVYSQIIHSTNPKVEEELVRAKAENVAKTEGPKVLAPHLLYHTIPYHTILYHAILYYTILYRPPPNPNPKGFIPKLAE